MPDPVIRVGGVSKRFRLYHERVRSIKENVLGRFRSGRTWEEFWALRDVSFDVHAGEMFALIGENGSGKSTMLKILARILLPDEGSVVIDGNVSALIELGAGFHPDFTGRENVFLNASILGFKRREIEDRFDEIVRFAELERFIDTPVKSYSSGMYMRLGFSIAIHVDPDVLLIDEILSVGDEHFQRKCLDKIQEFRRRGKTIVFVTHALGTVESMCERAGLLSAGQLLTVGPARDVVTKYRELSGGGGAPVFFPDVEAARTRRTVTEESVQQVMASVEQVRSSLEQVTEELRKGQETLAGALEAGEGRDERLLWIERRISEDMSIENAKERIVAFEKQLVDWHDHERRRDDVLHQLDARMARVEGIVAVHDASLEKVGRADLKPREWGSGEVKITAVTFSDVEGRPTDNFTGGGAFNALVEYEVLSDVADLALGIAIHDSLGRLCYGTNTILDGVEVPINPGKGRVRITIPRLAMRLGEFVASFSAHSVNESTQYHRLDYFYPFRVSPTRDRGGALEMTATWEIVNEDDSTTNEETEDAC
jgi:ABC-type polysaccharide/polyol phosphate transport system ATPase subunit